jgi:hypothetical protein
MLPLIFLLLVVVFSGNVFGADEPRPFSHPDIIHYDSHCLTINGKDIFIYSGAFHYFRCPKELWPDRFQKIKDAGFNCVETYAPWNWSERSAPASLNDFSKVDLRDLDDWMTMAEKYGFYIIIRPGPYICAEWDGGGYPQWLAALEKPDQPLRAQSWFRSDDPVYLAWCKHWYDAVCPVIVKHQITHKAPGQPGVILFQIENEYDLDHDFTDDIKLNQLNALANDARADGIDVPLITCWTKQIRGITSGVLRGVFDCSNFYTRWNVVKELSGKIARQQSQQPDAPVMTTEMQGGWFSKVGGKLSDQQDGINAAQIQNISLYAIQCGETAMSYYMLFGGTNPDDWSALGMTTTYDYNAPIREGGGVGDRYARVWALGHMLIDHGAKLARSDDVPVDATTGDTDVGAAERRAQDGSRYIFVRNNNPSTPKKGTVTVKEKQGADPDLTFDYDLEAFGSMVLYLPPGENDASKGEWLPKPAPPVDRPTDGLPTPIVIDKASSASEPLPTTWTKLDAGQKVESKGVLDRHFLYYHITGNPGDSVVMSKNLKDRVMAYADGKLLEISGNNGAEATFDLPSDKGEAVVLHNNYGEGNGGLAMELPDGIQSVKIGGTDAPLEFSGGESDRGVGFSAVGALPVGIDWKDVDISPNAAPAPEALLTWYRAEFALPDKNPALWVPWQVHIEANGNGFIYLNGHPLGRYWQVGPQHDFFLPECWLNFGAKQTNALALDLCPDGKGVSVQALSIVPMNDYAEKR